MACSIKHFTRASRHQVNLLLYVLVNRKINSGCGITGWSRYFYVLLMVVYFRIYGVENTMTLFPRPRYSLHQLAIALGKLVAKPRFLNLIIRLTAHTSRRKFAKRLDINDVGTRCCICFGGVNTLDGRFHHTSV